MNRKSKPLAALLVLLAALAFVSRQGFTQEPLFDLPWFTMDGSGGRSAGGNLEIMGTAGQPDAGVMAGDNLSVSGGYWYRSVTTALAADLSIMQAVSPGIAEPGDTVTYTLTYQNEGTAVATGVNIAMQKPAAIVNVSYTSGGAAVPFSENGDDLTWQAADLAPGEGGIITVMGVVDPGWTEGGEWMSTAVISADADSFNGNNSVQTALTVQNTGYAIYLPVVIK
ncbi:MAG: DUF11 domain-containing protein [Chloroflexi bacterium]|nr:DUF11 domain-containing protein [Chloroflexota bacterium]